MVCAPTMAPTLLEEAGFGAGGRGEVTGAAAGQAPRFVEGSTSIDALTMATVPHRLGLEDTSSWVSSVRLHRPTGQAVLVPMLALVLALVPLVSEPVLELELVLDSGAQTWAWAGAEA